MNGEPSVDSGGSFDYVQNSEFKSYLPKTTWQNTPPSYTLGSVNYVLPFL